MSNNWHTPTPDLISGDIARAEDINDKLTAVDVAFDKLPAPHPTQKGFDEPINVGEPTLPGHAASRNFTETAMTSQVVAAAGSATNAASSASSASTSATSATSSKNAAATSATNAATSATSASDSATSATSSKNAAATSATNAAASETAASGSATTASSAASAANVSKDAAAASASSASSSATSATSSKNAAATSATNAASSATAAATSATNAASSATAANTSKNAAASSATAASGSADAALASENKAEQWADEDEDVEVEAGKFSAKHWALKVEAGGASFGVVTGNTGTATSNGVGDTIQILGSNGITTVAATTPDTLTITPTYGTTPTQIEAGTAAGAGAANTIARTDHVHSISTAAATGLTATSANAEGTAGSLARSDHTHSISTGAPTTNLSATTTNATGSATSLARSNHSHAITTAAAVSLSATTSNGLGSAASLARSDHTHAISTAAPLSNLSATTTNAVGTASTMARSDHAHAITTAAPVALGGSASEGTSAGLARADHVHPFPTAANVGAISDPGSSGIVVRTGSGTAAVRSITTPSNGLSTTNGNGISGNPSIALADDVAAIEALSGTGIAVRTASNTWAQRTITVTGSGISISNGNGVSGNPALSLSANLADLSDLASTGIAVRTGSGWNQRTITGTAGEISVSNGNGVSGNPTLSFPSSISLTGHSVADGAFNVQTLRYEKSYTLAATTDLDTIVTGGFYDGTGLVNAPNGDTGWWYVEVQRHSNSTSYCLQKAYRLNSSPQGDMWIRAKATTWQPWQRVTTTASGLAIIASGDISTSGDTNIVIPSGSWERLTLRINGLKSGTAYSPWLRFNSDDTAAYAYTQRYTTSSGEDNLSQTVRTGASLSIRDTLMPVSGATGYPLDAQVDIHQPNRAEYKQAFYKSTYGSGSGFVLTEGSLAWTNLGSVSSIQFLLRGSTGTNPTGVVVNASAGSYQLLGSA